MFGLKCSSPGYGFVSGILFILFLFFAALSASLHCGKTLGPEKSFEYGKIFQEYGWETRTFEEGKKNAPLIQGGGLRQAHTIEKVENPSSRLLSYVSLPEGTLGLWWNIALTMARYEGRLDCVWSFIHYQLPWCRWGSPFRVRSCQCGFQIVWHEILCYTLLLRHNITKKFLRLGFRFFFLE